jgi:hypothetical protein
MNYTRLTKRFGSNMDSVRKCLRRATALIAAAVFVALLAGHVQADTLEVRIADGNDDAEEDPSGGIDLGSSDLEIGAEGGGTTAQWIGLRFLDIDIPRGATINSANIQFTVDETDDEVQTMPIQIFGEVGDGLAFSGSAQDITNRGRTGASVNWEDIPAWATEGEAGPDQLTPDIGPVVQSIVNQGTWAPNNPLVILMAPHANFERTAESFNGSADSAAFLTIDFDPTKLIVFGDFNADGAINLDDYNILTTNFHKTGATFAEGDFTFDGTVDLHDFVGFRQAFEAASVGAAAVPEPGGMILVMLGLAGFGGMFRRRR